MKLFFICSLLFLFFISCVYANNLSYNLEGVFALENSSLVDERTGLAGNNTNTVFNAGKLGNSAYFADDDDVVSLVVNSLRTNLAEGKEYTINCWVYYVQDGHNQYIMGVTDLNGTNGAYGAWGVYQDTRALYNLIKYKGVWRYNDGGLPLNVGAWNMVSQVWTNNSMYFYVNAINETPTNPTDFKITFTAGSPYQKKFVLGNACGYTGCSPSYENWDLGKIDECYVWDEALTDSQINFLYHSGYGRFYPGILVDIPYFNVTAYNSSNRNLIANYWAVINGTNYSTTNGSINSPLLSDEGDHAFVNVSVGADGFITEYFYNYNFTSDLNLTLNSFNINNCSDSLNYAVNFSFFDEDGNNNLDYDVMEIEALFGSSFDNLTFNYSDSDNSDDLFSVCVETNLTANFYLKHSRSDGFTNRFYLYNVSLGNQTFVYDLFNLDNVSDYSSLLVTVRSEDNYNYVENIVGTLQRNYLGEGVWRSVQMDKSGDFGLMTFLIREEDTDYRLVFRDEENHVLLTTETLKFFCDAGVCEITVLLGPYEVVEVVENMSLVVSYDNTSDLVNFSWANNDGNTVTVNSLVWKENMVRTVNICGVNQTGVSGVYSCNVSGFYGEVFAEVRLSGEKIFGTWIKVSPSDRDLSQNLDAEEQGFWTFAIMGTSFMFGLFSPVGAIIATFFGAVVVFVLGLFSPLTIMFLILAGVVGIAIGLKVRR